MDKRARLKKQMDFIIEVDKVKNIVRQTYLADGKRKENDAEHSWHLALMAVLLKEYAREEIDLSRVIPMVLIHQTYLADGKRKENDAEHSWHLALMAVLLKEYAREEIDLSRVIPMVLIHDLVEIDAGDTYAYDEEGASTKADREEKAANRIFGLLPKDQGTYFMELWREFEAYVEKKRLRTVFSGCFQRIRGHILWSSGENLKHMRAAMQNLPVCWITASRSF